MNDSRQEDDAVAALYRLPLAEFTPARDALAKRLAATGAKAAAAQVKKLKKPSIPAWAANQVVWDAPGEWQRLRAATATLRAAHESAPAVDELREAAREQRDALHACEARAAASLAGAGHAVNPSVTMVVSGTLLALAYGAGEPGRLERELPAPGFDVLLGLDLATARPALARPAPAAPTPPEAVPRAGVQAEAVEARVREEVRRARAARAAAEQRLAVSRRKVDAGQAKLTAIEERCRTLERELAAVQGSRDEARRELAEAQAVAARAAADLAALAEDAAQPLPPEKSKGR